MKKGKELKPHIGIFGRRNTGKSSLINTLTGQETAIVSEQPGTTTDPVKKSMEIFGIGPAVLVDTAGIDDTGELGQKRIMHSLEIIRQIDTAILVTDNNRLGADESWLTGRFRDAGIPFLILHNKSDLLGINVSFRAGALRLSGTEPVGFSALTGEGRDDVLGRLRSIIPQTAYRKPPMLDNVVAGGDLVLLVTPIDSEAPEGRLKLPMVMVQREILERGGIAIVMKDTKLAGYLRQGYPAPVLAVTDGSMFGRVADLLPPEIPLTSFSILLARTHGDFEACLENAGEIGKLQDGDRILLMESCTHEVTCDDISRYKLPELLRKATGKSLEFDVLGGSDRMDDVTDYAMLIHCGGCVITGKQVENRTRPALEAGVPVTNYGMALAWASGNLERATAALRRRSVPAAKEPA